MVKRSLPLQIVPRKSKYSIPAGTISAVEVSAKYLFVSLPKVNMWCPQTVIERPENASSATTNAG